MMITKKIALLLLIYPANGALRGLDRPENKEEVYARRHRGLMADMGSMSMTSAPVTSAPVTSAPVTSAPVTSAPVTPPPSAQHCGCNECTNEILSRMAGDYPCGDRINYLLTSHSATYPTEESACIRVAGVEFPTICGPECDPNRCDSTNAPITSAPVTSAPESPAPVTSAPVTSAPVTSAPVTSAPVTSAPVTPPPVTSAPVTPAPVTPAPVTPPPSPQHCGCDECTNEILSRDAGGYPCGNRINYLLTSHSATYPTEESACIRVAGVEFPTICGPECDPNRCDRTNAPITPAPVSAPSPGLTPTSSMYCFPEYNERTRFSNVWSKYTVEVKESLSAGICGPGNNKFTKNTVSVNGNELALEFKKVGGNWEASEVRVILPEAEMPFPYGTFSFSVKSVEVLNSSSEVTSQSLPNNLILGLFTWDTTEDYASHENYNHEVDVELSQWGNSNAPDSQFLMQPPGSPQLYRFYSGASGDTLDQGGHWYNFTWNPGMVSWASDAGGGKNHSYSTEAAIVGGYTDYVQCLPADVEVRMNLWMMKDYSGPVGLSDTDRVKVIIDDFKFESSGEANVADGGYCSKNCMCGSNSQCMNGKCVA